MKRADLVSSFQTMAVQTYSFHHTALGGAIPRDNDSCTYVPGEGRNGRTAATNVSVVGGTNDTSTSAAVVFGQATK